MALDSFNISITKLNVLPNFVIQLHSNTYANSSNIVYSLNANFSGTKNGLGESILISDIPVPYALSNNTTDLVDYNNLTKEIVSSWAEKGLILLKGETAIGDVQSELEQKIDAKLLLPPTVSLPWNS